MSYLDRCYCPHCGTEMPNAKDPWHAAPCDTCAFIRDRYPDLAEWVLNVVKNQVEEAIAKMKERM